jgi:hypothetical protein
VVTVGSARLTPYRSRAPARSVLLDEDVPLLTRTSPGGGGPRDRGREEAADYVMTIVARSWASDVTMSIPCCTWSSTWSSTCSSTCSSR